MNDFDFDAMQKKKIAQGAKHMKKRQKGCKLSTDNMTDKQIEKMHGEVFSVNVYEPITWNEFKKLTRDLQKTYYESISERYHVGLNKVGIELFGLAKNTLNAHFIRNNIKVKKVKNGISTKTEREAWKTFLKGKEKKPEEVSKLSSDVVKEEKTDILKSSFTFKNVSDIEEIAKSIKYFIPKGATITIIAEA